VRGAENSILPSISTNECSDLIARGIASGGMRAKLEAASDALQAGVGEVVIAPGARAGVIRELLAGKRIGTKLQ
jgi:acetylglutamate kinase